MNFGGSWLTRWGRKVSPAPRATGHHLPFALQEQRVARGHIDFGIAEDRGDAEEVDLRMMVQEEERHGVVDARIRIEDDLMHGRSPFLVVVDRRPPGGRDDRPEA